ncbi:molybdopterin-binding protein [Collibacillus ludicampi]|uniref:Molybdopterin-binding protein n=1 Tax=Collibacillus ludicampi TaxID=2771369 RepID=A0AAV4LCI1_9BACL|nr:molybdopterin-binding protein [Collibacillus ludicampi]GIM45399.1 molybdopterin-binding protein [Collibacillus ludicampi]
MEYSLLNKTEIRFTDIYLHDCDLTQLAQTVASVLQLPRDRVFVIDVREDHIALDLLVHSMKDDQFIGKKQELLDAIRSLPGVTLGPDADIHSEGVLGMIALSPIEAKQVVEKSTLIGEEIQNRVRRRVKVFPTGFEVAKGMIEDANTPYLVERFTEAGCKVQTHRPLADDVDEIAGALRQALDQGFGLIVTTGGVGAEDKDCTVEALLKVCPEAVTPYIVKFTRGHGRHVKDGIRIGVAKEGLTYLVTLPGPHDEVRLCTDVLVESIDLQPEPEVLAERLAGLLRQRWMKTVAHQHGHHSTS